MRKCEIKREGEIWGERIAWGARNDAMCLHCLIILNYNAETNVSCSTGVGEPHADTVMHIVRSKRMFQVGVLRLANKRMLGGDEHR